MEMTEERASIVQWLQTEFAVEQQAGFPVLKRVPDTQVIRFLDHFAGLDQARQSALKAILFEWSSYSLFDAPSPNPMWKPFQQATAFPERRGGRRYTGVKLLAGLAKDNSHGGLSGYFRTMGIEGLALEPPQCLLGDTDALVPIGIPSLRRKVNVAFSRLFAPKLTDLSSETWRYEGVLDGCQIRVDIRYSGKMAWPQLAYSAQVRGKGRQIVCPNLSFESVLGVGFGHWDYLTKENTDRSVELLSELVNWLARLPDRLPPGCCVMPTE
jgi:hypothetical protein